MRGSSALLGLLIAGHAAAAGFRHDGTAVVRDAAPPVHWSHDEGHAWIRPLPAWSNASPVRVGPDLVCACAEPVTLLCVDAATGGVRWERSLAVLDALPPEEQARLRPVLEQVARDEAELVSLREEHSRLRREARRGDAAAEAALPAVAKRVLELQASIERWRDYRTPPDQEMIGWSTPTPATDGSAVYVLFGNGVIARLERDGTRTWARWLGPPPRPMNGFGFGTSASPLFVDGTLVVPYGTLRGLDPATGATRWEAGPYRDFGTPAIARVAGTAWLVTPDGRAVRARDGVVGATGLGAVYWTGPTALGDHVWFAGSTGNAHEAGHGNDAWLIRLAPAGEDRLTATKVWSVHLPGRERVYATPVVHDGRLYFHDDAGVLTVLDAATGGKVQSLRLPSGGSGHMASAVVAGDAMFVGSEHGGTDVFRITPDGLVHLRTNPGDGYRSTPLPDGERLYVRTFRALVALRR